MGEVMGVIPEWVSEVVTLVWESVTVEICMEEEDMATKWVQKIGKIIFYNVSKMLIYYYYKLSVF